MPECFPPVVGKDARVLILGTMPGLVSLRQRQYYAHPQNQFWRLLGLALREDLAGLPYARRLAAVKRRGVALWEVFASCERPGSLDADITEAEPNDVPRLAREHGIKAVFCNGATSWSAYRRLFSGDMPAGVEAFPLPSSSPAHAGRTLEQKSRAWTRISLYLGLALAAFPARAAELDLRQLVDKANKALRGESSHGTMSMTIVNPKWKRTIEVEGWNRQREYAYIFIKAPAKDRGNITLRRKNDMWLWIEKVERVIKVPPTMMHSAWQGSDFTYEDIVKADSVVKDYSHKLLETKTEEGRTVYTVECLPKPEAAVVWGKVLLWIAVYDEQAVPLKEEDYNERGELVRTITLSDVKTLGGRLLPSRLECVPAKKPGQKTELVYHTLEFDVPLNDGFFSPSRLQKGLER